MASISIVGPQGGEHVNLGSVKMRILEDGGTTAQRIGLTVSTLPPHTDGPAQHRHTAHDEGFYIISGTAGFTSGNDVQDAPAGSFVMIPPVSLEARKFLTAVCLGDEPDARFGCQWTRPATHHPGPVGGQQALDAMRLSGSEQKRSCGERHAGHLK